MVHRLEDNRSVDNAKTKDRTILVVDIDGIKKQGFQNHRDSDPRTVGPSGPQAGG